MKKESKIKRMENLAEGEDGWVVSNEVLEGVLKALKGEGVLEVEERRIVRIHEKKVRRNAVGHLIDFGEGQTSFRYNEGSDASYLSGFFNDYVKNHIG